MSGHRWRRKSAIGTAPCRWNVVAKLRQAFDVGFIDDRVLPGNRRSAFFTPGERFVDNHALGHAARVVAPVERQIGARTASPVTEMRVTPDEPPYQLFRIRIDEELVRIEAQPTFGLIWA